MKLKITHKHKEETNNDNTLTFTTHDMTPEQAHERAEKNNRVITYIDDSISS